MEKIKIKDESGDRKYWTQIPNYIANHSTANDQALYFQMKRYAGENGQCFATQETIMKKMGIGRMAYNKALNYLLKKKWIRFTGMTNGKTRPIKTYSIVDIWKLNIMEYEKIPSRTAVSSKKIPSETTGDTGQNSSKIPTRTAIEEEPYKEELLKKNISVKTDNWIKDILSWLEEKRNSKFADYGKQIGALGRLQKSGYSPTDIKNNLIAMEQDQFWKDKNPDFVNLASNIHKIKKLNSVIWK